MMRAELLSVVLLIVTAACGLASAEPHPGALLTFESIDGKQTDARVSRLLALCVPEKSNPTPFLSSGPFRATLTGFINVKLRGEYTFTSAGTGSVEFILNGQPALGKPVRLKKGTNAFVVNYESPEKGDAILRVSWAERNAPAEPIPPVVLTHESNDSLENAATLREGRELFATLRCIKCHDSSEISPRDGTMPELALDAPNLDDVGARLNPDWLAHWINDPRSIRKDASMPRIFHSDALDSRAIDVAKYLASRGKPKTTNLNVDESQVASGTRLFTGLGCVACHVAPQSKSAEDETRVPLCYIGQKFTPAGLIEFLKQPQRHYAWTRMPDFALNDDEVAQLAAFLIARSPENLVAPVDFAKADGKRGQELFSSSGCVNCHAPAEKSGMSSPSLASIKDWTRGCMSASPDFGLNDHQRAALAQFAGSGFDSLKYDCPPEFAERQVAALNCTACHVRDRQQDRWSTLDPEIQTLEANLSPAQADKSEIGGDQARPVLTWSGDKLKPDWMSSFIAGKVAYKPRPWLRARMPAFPARAKGIAEGFSFEHGWPLAIPDEPPADPEMVAIGKRLIGRGNGFSCNQCHAISTSAALVPFDSPAPNFSHTFDRMRQDFYHRWVRSPQKYQPGTRMPQYADSDGKTAYKDVLDGDAEQQFEAIWQYLRAGEKVVPPE